jgi:putative nucleotidyltransferase-like protein
MPRPSIRFRPPRLELAPEVRWMLLRAFGPVAAPFAAPPAADAALATARRFELSARIASRQGRQQLALELGADAASGFQRDRMATAAVGLRLLELAGQLARAAEPLALPLVFLKFVALEAAGLDVVGSRPACDVDVLVPAPRAREFQRALLGRGYRASGHPATEHQLPGLAHPAGGTVELHRMVLGVRPAGKASATVESLARDSLLVPLPDFAGSCAIPVPAVQAAHALVHGIGQHGYWPDSYSLFKTLSDLVDLGFADAGSTGVAFEALARRAHELVERDVAAAEAEAVRRLCAALVAGSDPAGWDPEAGEAVLLRHVVAGRLDPEYAASLRLGLFRAQPSDRPPAARLLYSVLGTVFLSRAQIDAIYGPPRHPIGYLGRRLSRPFDLLLRLGHYGTRALRQKT